MKQDHEGRAEGRQRSPPGLAFSRAGLQDPPGTEQSGPSYSSGIAARKAAAGPEGEALAADRGSQTIEGEGASAPGHWETSGIVAESSPPAAVGLYKDP